MSITTGRLDAEPSGPQLSVRMGSSYEPIPEVVFSTETLDLIELDIGVPGHIDASAGNPPLGAGQAGRQVGTRPRATRPLGRAGLSHHVTVRRLPQPDLPAVVTKHDGVVPPKDHRLGAVWGYRDGYQVPG